MIFGGLQRAGQRYGPSPAAEMATMSQGSGLHGDLTDLRTDRQTQVSAEV